MNIGAEKNEQIEAKDLHEKVDIKTKDLVRDEKMPVEMFNRHYAHIIEKTSGIVTKILGNLLDPNPMKKLFVKLLKTIEIIKIK